MYIYTGQAPIQWEGAGGGAYPVAKQNKPKQQLKQLFNWAQSCYQDPDNPVLLAMQSL